MARHSDDAVARSGEQQGKITIAFLVLAWYFILLRIWTRTYVISSFGWDDSTMVLAGCMFTVYCVAQLYIEGNGGGTHVTSIPQLQNLTKWVVISEAMYIIAMMVLKISLGIFFARIVIKRWHFLLIYITVGVTIFSSAAAFFYSLFRCGPNIDDYVIQQLTGKCMPRYLDRFMAYQQAAFVTLTDLVFVMLPVSILWNSNMSRRSKISAGAILGLATLGCVCSLLRFRYVDGLTQTDDFFWHATNIAIWSTIECGTCIIAGCLATLRPLLICVYARTRGATVFSSCVKQISRSFGSTDRSASSSTPRYNTTNSSGAKSRIEEHELRTTHVDDPAFAEFIAPPGQSVVLLDSDFGTERKSTERILVPQDSPELEFPWPIKKKEDRKRQTMYASWTMKRGTGNDGRTSDRPSSAPVSPSEDISSKNAV